MDDGETRALAPNAALPLGVNLAIDPDEQLATRAAWLYFVAGLTQAQIGKKLGLNRTRVNRLLAQARDQGLVQINITGRLASCVELEEKLKQRFGLEDATVVPTPPDQALIPQVIATAAAAALSARLKDGVSAHFGPKPAWPGARTSSSLPTNSPRVSAIPAIRPAKHAKRRLRADV